MKITNFQIKKQNISRILIGSNNKGKIKEIRDLIPKKVEILGAGDFNLIVLKKTEKLLQKIHLLKQNTTLKKLV